MKKFLGVELAPLRLPLERRLQTTAALFFAGLFLFGGFCGIFICSFLLFTRFYWISLIYITWFYYDLNSCNRGGRRSQWVRGWRVWKHFRNYFPITLVKTADLDPNRNYLMGYHPHGIMCAGAFSNFASEETDFAQQFPEMTPYLLTLEGQFWFPLHREIFLSMGGCAATREGIEWLLTREGTGNAIALVIGGAAEALDAHPGTVTLTLRRRKGFVKLALKHGASLVPMFSFGENELFWQMQNPTGSFLRSLQTKLTKILGFSPPLFKGRGVFQYSIGFLPYRKPITTVVGKPIDLEQIANATQEQIDKVHERYIQGLQELFEENKAKYGAAGVKLIIT